MPADTYARVYAFLARVPAGRVVSYGQIARAIGLPNGARVVGWAMRHCPEGLPWHRVVDSKGQMLTAAGPDSVPLQRTLLEEEGVEFGLTGRVDLAQYQWDES